MDTTLSARVLNRTLMQRQHLLARTSMTALSMTEHLLGLQAQDTLPPYLSLWSRLEGFDHRELTGALTDRTAVRVLLMRGTIHLVTPQDACLLRPWVQPGIDQATRTTQASKGTADLSRGALAEAAREVLDAGPLPLKTLAEELVGRFPGHLPSDLAHKVREMMPLVQVPPRGLWKQSGGVVYATCEQWVGAPMHPEPDPAEIVRRYLRAFGPATPADVTVWSRVSGIRAVIEALGDELVRYRDEHGKAIFDLAGMPLATGDEPAPVRLLGRYDNVWLSHADRGRVAEPQKRRHWMGVNGGVGAVLLVDGMLEGLWRVAADGSIEHDLLRPLTRSESRALAAETERAAAFLAS